MNEARVDPDDIVSRLSTSTSDISTETNEWFPELQKEKEASETIEDTENKGIIVLRNRWATWILILIVLIVVFDMVLVGLVGMEVWQFNNTSIVIAVITDNFLKIVGLGYLITSRIFEKIFK